MSYKTPEQMAEEWANAESDLWFADISTYTDGHKSAVKQAYLAGYQAAQQWISVKDRLPECSTGVLIYVNFQAHNITFRYYTVALFNGTSWDDNSRNFVTHWMSPPIVTHWMPLPKPPTKEGL